MRCSKIRDDTNDKDKPQGYQGIIDKRDAF